MKEITLEQYHAELKSQGVPIEHCAMICPVCGTIQSGHDLIKAGAGKDFGDVIEYLGFSCVGRFNGAGGFERDRTPKKFGCDWTLGGFLRVHKMVVETPDGAKHPRFELATPEQAQEHMKENSTNETRCE